MKATSSIALLSSESTAIRIAVDSKESKAIDDVTVIEQRNVVNEREQS
jgi:hypothetical protein